MGVWGGVIGRREGCGMASEITGAQSMKGKGINCL